MGGPVHNRGGLGKSGMGFPTPETDYCPEFTKFINDMGDLYAKSVSWHKRSSNSVSDSYKQRTLKSFAHYFSEEFIKVLKRELQIPD